MKFFAKCLNPGCNNKMAYAEGECPSSSCHKPECKEAVDSHRADFYDDYQFPFFYSPDVWLLPPAAEQAPPPAQMFLPHISP